MRPHNLHDSLYTVLPPKQKTCKLDIPPKLAPERMNTIHEIVKFLTLPTEANRVDAVVKRLAGDDYFQSNITK